MDQFLQGITDIVRRVNDSSLGKQRPNEQRSPPRKGSIPKGAGAIAQIQDDAAEHHQFQMYEK